MGCDDWIWAAILPSLNLLCAKSGTENLLEARGGYWSVQGRAEAGTEMKCPVELSDVNKTCKNDEDGITGPR